MRRLIPADQLERAVLDVVRDTLLSTPGLKAQLVQRIETQRQQTDVDATDLAKLESERTKIGQQIEFVIDSLGIVGKDAAKAKLQQLEAKLTAVIERIEQARAAKKIDARSPDAVADEMIAKLTQVAATIQTLPMPTLRSLLTNLIARLEVDMTTKAVQIDLVIPAWGNGNALCLEDKAVQRSVYQAQYEIPLDSADCSYRRIGRTPCFDCRRTRQAA